MNFSFYITVLNPVELQKEINEVLDFWWPKQQWSTNVISVEQILVEPEETETGKPVITDELSFHVIAEVHKLELENQVRTYG